MGYQGFHETLLNEILEATDTKPFVFVGVQKIHRDKALNAQHKLNLNTVKKDYIERISKPNKMFLKKELIGNKTWGHMGHPWLLSRNQNSRQPTIVGTESIASTANL